MARTDTTRGILVEDEKTWPPGGWMMVCPFCQDTYVHHSDVEIYQRKGEDLQSYCLSTFATDGQWMECPESLNPSSRRHGLRIWFWGECGHEWSLEIAQHKGETFVSVVELEPLLQPTLETMPYADYLQTDHWKQVRESALARAEHRCQLCNSGANLNVHHRTYENRGNERDSDVTVLCKSCHERFHVVTNGRVTNKVR